MPAVEERAYELGLDAEKVLEWRHTKLVEAGYNHADAKLIARRTDVDLHRAVRLVRSGCSSEQARRIVL